MKISHLALALILLSILSGSCSALRIGKGVKGEVTEDGTIVLAGDTFNIIERIGDSLLIVRNNGISNENTPRYLLKHERNGLYYPQVKSADITTIYNTTNYVGINDKHIYDIKAKKVLFTPPCSVWDLHYLGKLNDLLLFASFDTICFSDGKCVGLQHCVNWRMPKKEGMVTLVAGAQTIDASFEELHKAEKTRTTPDSSIERFAHNYHFTRDKHRSAEPGFSVDLDIPKGDATSDKAIRDWMTAAIRTDIFSLFEENSQDIPVGKCASVKDMRHTLDEYGTLWEKIYDENEMEETLEDGTTCDISVRKVADCDDYTTYHYWASLYNGGLHELPREYYITYDKRRCEFLDVSNSVHPSMMQQFRHLVLENLKKQYDSWHQRESSWDDFTNSIFSFHCTSSDLEEMDKAMLSLLEPNYSCDNWAGWKGYNEVPFTEKDFPLTHFAVLPEGIVLTYHPYQIDCFAAGEYHAVIPFKDANKCLMFDYSGHEDLIPNLQKFIR